MRPNLVALLGAFAALTLAGSAAGFMYSLGAWHRGPTESPPATSDTGSTFLSVYSGEPDARAEVTILFGENDGSATVILNWLGVRDPRRFRWALVGSGDNRFDVTADHLASEPEWTEAMDSPAFVNCRAVHRIARPGAVVVGGLDGARVPGGPWVADGTDGFIMLRVRFPQLRVQRVGNTYERGLPNVGSPTDDDVKHIGNTLIFEPQPLCIDLDPSDTDDGQHRLRTSSNVDYEVSIPPLRAGDESRLADPPVPPNGDARWQFSNSTSLWVRYTDQSLVRTEQAALFGSGILGGLSGGFAVSVVVEHLQQRRRRTNSKAQPD